MSQYFRLARPASKILIWPLISGKFQRHVSKPSKRKGVFRKTYKKAWPPAKGVKNYLPPIGGLQNHGPLNTSVETTILGLPKLHRLRHEIQVKSFFHIQNYGYWNNIPYHIAYALQIGWDNNVGDQISYIAPILMKNISLFSEFNRDFNYVVRISVHWQLKN